jgi:hypothetical protein
MDDQQESRPPQDKTELLTRIRAEWDALMTAIRSLSPQQMTTPDASGWSPKDNLAHLAAWENWLVRYHLGSEAPHDVLGLDEESFNCLDETAINALIFQRNKDKSLETVLSELNEAHRQVIARLDSLDFDVVMAARYDDDPAQRPLLDWVIGNTYEHFQEHRRTIESVSTP